MKKYDLCTGDIVLSTKGSYGIVLIGTNGDDQINGTVIIKDRLLTDLDPFLCLMRILHLNMI